MLNSVDVAFSLVEPRQRRSLFCKLRSTAGWQGIYDNWETPLMVQLLRMKLTSELKEVEHNCSKKVR